MPWIGKDDPRAMRERILNLEQERDNLARIVSDTATNREHELRDKLEAFAKELAALSSRALREIGKSVDQWGGANRGTTQPTMDAK